MMHCQRVARQLWGPSRWSTRFSLQLGCPIGVRACRGHSGDLSHCACAGHSVDLSHSVMDRAMSHSDGSFRLPASRIRGRLCRTNQASHTAFRGFGGPQGMMVCNMWMDHVARAVGVPLPSLQRLNLYAAEGDVTHFGQVLTHCRLPRCWEEVVAMASLEARRVEVDAFNATSRCAPPPPCPLPSNPVASCPFTPPYAPLRLCTPPYTPVHLTKANLSGSCIDSSGVPL